MPSSTVSLGSLTALAFGSFTAEVVSGRFTGTVREAPDVTRLTQPQGGIEELGESVFGEVFFGGTPFPEPTAAFFGRRVFLPGPVDPGTLECEFHFNPDTGLPMQGAPDSASIVWPDGAIWEGEGFWVAFEVKDIQVGGVMLLNGSFKFSGPITVTAAP